MLRFLAIGHYTREEHHGLEAGISGDFVSDVDRARVLLHREVGCAADHDHRVSDEIRFVQLTPRFSLLDRPPASSRPLEPWRAMATTAPHGLV